MPNDAKFGLFFGMGLVIVVAVLFFRKDLPGVNLAAGNSPIWTLGDKATGDGKHAPNGRPVGGRRHTVQEGDTLFNLAKKYYGDKEQFSTIYEVNRDQVHAPDRLTPGTVLVIPDLPPKK
jgi:phage tail protein X